MKSCATCLRLLSEGCFHKKADARDGLYPHCKECRKTRDAQYRERNIDKLREYDKQRVSSPHRLARHKQAYESKKTEYLARAKAYGAKNPEVVRRAKKAYKQRNPHLVQAATRKRQTRKLHAVPKWANDFFIREIYDLARRRTKATGFRWVVDHTVPLLSKQVCGLHCEANLNVIPQVVNATKGNRTWPDM